MWRMCVAKVESHGERIPGRTAPRAEDVANRLVGALAERSMFFFFQAEDGIRDLTVTGVQTCALPILAHGAGEPAGARRASDLHVVRESFGSADEERTRQLEGRLPTDDAIRVAPLHGDRKSVV